MEANHEKTETEEGIENARVYLDAAAEAAARGNAAKAASCLRSAIHWANQALECVPGYVSRGSRPDSGKSVLAREAVPRNGGGQ